MQIGDLARATGCRAVTIRYYERIGVLPPPTRAANNYRIYGDGHLQRLRFVRRMRDLGFSLEEVRTLLRLIDGGDYSCDDVKDLATRHLEEVQARLRDLKSLESVLADLVGQCTGGSTPDCSMLEVLFAGTRIGAGRPRGSLEPYAGTGSTV